MIRPLFQALGIASAIASAAATVGICQGTPNADSVAKLNRASRWDQAGSLARNALAASPSVDEQCGLLVGLAYADARIGRLDDVKPLLDSFLERCRSVPSARRYDSAADDLRREATLPKLATTGIDFSSVDAFWRIADLLAKDAEPTEAQWHALFATPGYRLSMRLIRSTRSDLEIALRPSRRPTFDSLAASPNTDVTRRVQHLARAYSHRGELTAYRDSIAKELPTEHALALTRRFLPPGVTNGRQAPLVAFALFRDDAFSLDPEAIVVDLEHVRLSADLTLLLAHEFHHSFLLRLDQMTFPTGRDASVTLVRALRDARMEGIADLIDKPYPVSRSGPNGAEYSAMYNEAYARTPAVIHSIDSALVVAADDSTKLEAVGMRVQHLLPSGGHFNGSYVAREIYETFGVDSLFPGVTNLFAFWRAYGEAEVKRGHRPPFSPKAVALLNALERKYLPARPVRPYEF